MHSQALDLLFGQRYFDWSATRPIKVLRWRAERYSDGLQLFSRVDIDYDLSRKPRKTPRSRSKRKTYIPSPCHTFDSHDERRGLLIMSIITIVAGAIAIQTFGN